MMIRSSYIKIELIEQICPCNNAEEFKNKKNGIYDKLTNKK